MKLGVQYKTSIVAGHLGPRRPTQYPKQKRGSITHITRQHLIPRLNPVNRQIVPSLQVSIHPQETRHGPINRVTERRRVERNLLVLPQIATARCVRGQDSLGQVLHPLVRLATASEVDRPDVVAARNLARQKEVLFAHVARTLSDGGGEVTRCICRHLDGLVIAKSVNVQHTDGHAGEVLQLLADRWHPLAQTVLDGSELGDLAAVVVVHAESFGVAELWSNS